MVISCRPWECLKSGDLIKDSGIGFNPPLLLTQASGKDSVGRVAISAIHEGSKEDVQRLLA